MLGLLLNSRPDPLCLPINDKIKNKDYNVGNDLRKLIEQILKEISKNLEVKMKFLYDGPNEMRMPAEMLSELRSKLNKNKCDIKNEKAIDNLQSSSFIMNMTSHDSPPLDSTGDIKQVIRDIEEFETLFSCADCSKFVSLEYKDISGKKVRCRCGSKELTWTFA